MHLLEHEKDLWTLGDELTLTAGVELGNEKTLSVYLLAFFSGCITGTWKRIAAESAVHSV